MIKKTLNQLVVFLLLSTPLCVVGQKEIKLGLNAGANYSSLRGNDFAEANDPAFNFIFGASFEISIKENLSILTNVNYEGKRLKRDAFLNSANDTGVPSELQFSLNYLTIPLLLKYNFGSNRNFFITTGGYYGVFLNSKAKLDGEEAKNILDDSLFKNSDFGLVAGLGTSLNLNETNNINLELRYNLGLSNISAVEVFGNGSLKTGSLNLILNWDFAL